VTTRQRLVAASLGAAGVLVLTAIGIDVVQRRPSPHLPRTFEIQVRASGGTTAQLFWAADLGFAGERSLQVPLQRMSEGFQLLRFPLPPDGVRWLRFDPTDAPGEVVIGNVRLLDANGNVLETFDPRSFKRANQIASMTQEDDGGTRFTTTTGATDPFLVLSVGDLDRPSLRGRLSLVTPTALLLATIIAISLVAASTVAIGVAAFATAQRASPSDTPGRLWLSAGWIALLFLIVFSAKLLFMRQHPVTAPFWDQWDGEAALYFVPYQHTSLAWRTMFDLHNEHRVFFTRLLALDLLAVNGEWDPRLEQVANAAMHALTGVLVGVIFWVAGERRRLDLLVLVCALTFALPFSWDNTLFGFQSAFYFLLLFSVLALGLTTSARVGTAAWWLGWLCVLCGLFTAAGGVLIPVAIAGVVALKVLDDRRGWRDALINAGAIACVLALGVSVASPPIQEHAYLKAKTAADFLVTLGHNLAWPWLDHPLVSIAVWLPLVVLLAGVALRRGSTNPFERLTVGLGLWVALQAAALAYGRGAGGAFPAGRYLDFLSLGFVANTMALQAALDRARESRRGKRIALACLVGWLAVGVVGIDRLTSQSLVVVTVWSQYFAAHAANVRRFVVTDEAAEFTAKRPLFELPYPNPERLATLLRDPDIRRILPTSIREPIRVQPRPAANAAFVPEVENVHIPHDPLARGWWSLSAEGRRAQGRFESAPAGPCHAGGHLAFQVSGYLGWDGQYLAVKDLETGIERAIRPPRVAGEDWVEARIPCPKGPFVIVAIDRTSESWFGFREPVEIGWASPLVESLIDSSRFLLLAALALAVLAVRWTGAAAHGSHVPSSYMPSSP
jgi:hypothetical protein